MSSPERKSRIPAGRAAVTLTIVLVLALALVFNGPGGGAAAAAAGCGKLKVRSEVVSRFPRVFANQYEKKLKVAVQSGRRAVSDWRVQLYTFGGFLLGESAIDRRMTRSETATMKLRVPIQPGRYTLVTKGAVPGCGELERDEVINFRDCLNGLPISFADKPGGSASDYGRYLSVKIAPKPVWTPLVDVHGTLSNFNGDVYGKAELPRGRRKLIGAQFLDFKLKSGGLDSGGYSVYVSGKARQPRSCGDLSKSTVLEFR